MERKESIGKDATSKETLEDLEKNEESVSDKSDEDNLPTSLTIQTFPALTAPSMMRTS